MATSAIAGHRGEIFASSSAGGTATKILEVTEFTLHVAMSEINATSHDSSGDREVIAGVRSWDGSAAYMYVIASSGHKNAIDRALDSGKVDFAWYPTGSSSDGYMSGSGYINDWELTAPNEDALASNISIVGTGGLTRTSSA